MCTGTCFVSICAAQTDAPRGSGNTPSIPTVTVDWQTMAVQAATPLKDGANIVVRVRGLVPACFDYRIDVKQARSQNSDVSTLADFGKNLGGPTATGSTGKPESNPPGQKPSPLPHLHQGVGAAAVQTAVKVETDRVIAATGTFKTLLTAALNAGCRGRGRQLRAQLADLRSDGGAAVRLRAELEQAQAIAAAATSFVDQTPPPPSADGEAVRASVQSLRAAMDGAQIVLAQFTSTADTAGASGESLVLDTLALAEDADSIKIAIQSTPLTNTSGGVDAADQGTAAASPHVGSDEVWVRTARTPPRVSISAGYMGSGVDDRHYTEVQLPKSGSTTDTYRTFANAGGHSMAAGPVALGTVRLFDPVTGFGTDWSVGLTLGTMIRTVNNDQKSEWVAGLSLDAADLFFLTVGVHHGRREYLLIGPPGTVQQSAVPAAITRDNAVGVEWVNRLAVGLSVRIR